MKESRRGIRKEMVRKRERYRVERRERKGERKEGIMIVF